MVLHMFPFISLSTAENSNTTCVRWQLECGVDMFLCGIKSQFFIDTMQLVDSHRRVPVPTLVSVSLLSLA